MMVYIQLKSGARVELKQGFYEMNVSALCFTAR